ncbi:uncharacterized protein LOC144693491 isoform X2 [Cetorhinus maximus]
MVEEPTWDQQQWQKQETRHFHGGQALIQLQCHHPVASSLLAPHLKSSRMHTSQCFQTATAAGKLSTKGKETAAPRFSDTLLECLLDVVEARQDVLYPSSGHRMGSGMTNQAWEAVPAVVSANAVQKKIATQCRKRVNDLFHSARVSSSSSISSTLLSQHL